MPCFCSLCIGFPIRFPPSPSVEIEHEWIKPVRAGRWDTQQSPSECHAARAALCHHGTRASCPLALGAAEGTLQQTDCWASYLNGAQRRMEILLSIFQNEADCFATPLQIWEPPSR